MLNGAGVLPTADVINGQLTNVTPAYSVSPAAFGPAPIQYDTYASQPTLPPYTSPGQGNPASGGSVTAGADQANVTAAAAASANPWSIKLSPLVWTLLFLGVGVLGLRMFHWRG